MLATFSRTNNNLSRCVRCKKGGNKLGTEIICKRSAGRPDGTVGMCVARKSRSSTSMDSVKLVQGPL